MQNIDSLGGSVGARTTDRRIKRKEVIW